MVEFMLTIVVVFIVFISMLQIMLLMHAYNTVADGAKEGMRYAIVHGTSLGAGSCSGPGSVASVTPAVTCTDSTGTHVVSVVQIFTSLTFQGISSSAVNVDYDPASANTSNSNFGRACSQAGCLVRVTVSHAYNPLFGLGWPSVTLNAAADGRIAN
jgi:Flp pilus assembly protein TadG